MPPHSDTADGPQLGSPHSDIAKKTVTQYDDYERITTFFLSPSEQKEGFRQTGARRHAFGEVMRKVSVRQLPKSAYGAQLHEIHR